MAWPNDTPDALWRVEDNGGALYRILHIPTGQYFTTLLYQPGTALSQSTVVADAIRRAKVHAGTPQTILFQENGVFDAPQIGSVSGQTTHGDYGFWGANQAGSFIPITELYFRTLDVTLKARIRGTMNVGSRIKNSVGQSITPGLLDALRFYGVNFHLDTNTKHHVTSPNATLGSNLDVQGRIGFSACTFTGDQLWDGSGLDQFGRLYDCKSAFRMGFCQLEAYDCELPTCGEHCFYLDAPQGGATIWNCFNTSDFGLAGACTGRTFFKSVQRAEDDSHNPGYGLPGYGTIHLKGCTARRPGHNDSAGSIDIAGFLGDIYIEDYEAIDCDAGVLTLWSAAGDGVWTTQGGPIHSNFPTGAHTTRRLFISGLTANIASTWVNPTSAMKIDGCQEVQIGEFNISGTANLRPTLNFWSQGDGNSPGSDPFDNGIVAFVPEVHLPSGLGPGCTFPVTSYGGWNGASVKCRYKQTNMTPGEIDALWGIGNNQYPPGGGGPPSNPINGYGKIRGGHRLAVRGMYDAASGGRSGKVRSGSRVTARGIFDTAAGGRHGKIRSGTRMRAVGASTAAARAGVIRGGHRMAVTVNGPFSGIPSNPNTPEPVFLQAGELVMAGSEEAQLVMAGSVAGELVLGGGGPSDAEPFVPAEEFESTLVLLYADGTTPPDPLSSEDGSEWLYADP